jgi:hypothetical protein
MLPAHPSFPENFPELNINQPGTIRSLRTGLRMQTTPAEHSCRCNVGRLKTLSLNNILHLLKTGVLGWHRVSTTVVTPSSWSEPPQTTADRLDRLYFDTWAPGAVQEFRRHNMEQEPLEFEDTTCGASYITMDITAPGYNVPYINKQCIIWGDIDSGGDAEFFIDTRPHLDSSFDTNTSWGDSSARLQMPAFFPQDSWGENNEQDTFLEPNRTWQTMVSFDSDDDDVIPPSFSFSDTEDASMDEEPIQGEFDDFIDDGPLDTDTDTDYGSE